MVLAAQGPSDLEELSIARCCQGSQQDAERVQALLGQAWVEGVAWHSDGLTTTRRVEQPRVPIDVWLNTLEPGDARGYASRRLTAAGACGVALPVSDTALGHELGTQRRTLRLLSSDGMSIRTSTLTTSL